MVSSFIASSPFKFFESVDLSTLALRRKVTAYLTEKFGGKAIRKRKKRKRDEEGKEKVHTWAKFIMHVKEENMSLCMSCLDGTSIKHFEIDSFAAGSFHTEEEEFYFA